MMKIPDLPILYVVVPCYNEEEVLPISSKAILEKLTALIDGEKISPKSRILFVDDGSRDSTWEIISKLHLENSLFSGLKLAANRGHQNALLAGLMTAKISADCAVSMDADLQDDINAIDGFLEEYKKGCDIVYGVRSSRKKDSFFKRTTAECYYKLLKLMGVEIVFNHADYRLMSRRALEALEEYKEVNLFLRGMIPCLGFKTAKVFYERKERAAGESKYPLKKMISLALDGISSFSVKPIKLIGNMGIIISALSVFGLLYALISKFFGHTVDGWTAIVASIWLIGGIQLFSLGVIGTYIGKIYNEAKARPRYFVEEYLDDAEIF